MVLRRVGNDYGSVSMVPDPVHGWEENVVFACGCEKYRLFCSKCSTYMTCMRSREQLCLRNGRGMWWNMGTPICHVTRDCECNRRWLACNTFYIFSYLEFPAGPWLKCWTGGGSGGSSRVVMTQGSCPRARDGAV